MKLEALKFKVSRLVKSGQIKVIDLEWVRALDLNDELKDGLYSLDERELHDWSRFECELVEQLETKN